jgi:glycosyltransferase involved in cell wall biosynthesis
LGAIFRSHCDIEQKDYQRVRILIGMPEEGSQGGSVKCEPPFIRELRRLGRQVEEQVYTYADTQVGLARRIVRVVRTALRFRKRLRSGSFDIVHLNTSFDMKALLRDCFTVSLLNSSGARIFLKFHGSDARLLKTKNPALAFVWRRLLSRVDGIGLLSSEERANFLQAGVSEQKLFVVSNVVDTLAPISDLSEPTIETSDIPLLLFIGRLIPEKGIRDVIHACQLLRERNQEFRLVCLGDGRARRDAEREVARLNLQEYVRFVGYIPEEEAAAFYANSTMLLFPTYHDEGFPMVIFNAAAAGLPIITTRIRAAADYLREPDNCLWATERRPDVLADKIIDLLKTSELRTKMSCNNKQLAAQFSAEIVTGGHLRVYEQIVNGPV